MTKTRQEALEEMVAQLRAIAAQLNVLTTLATQTLGLAAISNPMNLIAVEVAREFGIDRATLLSRRRARSICVPRHLAFYLCIELCGASYPEVGRVFNRDHGTIMHGYNVVRGWKGPLAARREAMRGRLTKMLELEGMIGGAA